MPLTYQARTDKPPVGRNNARQVFAAAALRDGFANTSVLAGKTYFLVRHVLAASGSQGGAVTAPYAATATNGICPLSASLARDNVPVSNPSPTITTRDKSPVVNALPVQDDAFAGQFAFNKPARFVLCGNIAPAVCGCRGLAAAPDRAAGWFVYFYQHIRQGTALADV